MRNMVVLLGSIVSITLVFFQNCAQNNDMQNASMAASSSMTDTNENSYKSHDQSNFSVSGSISKTVTMTRDSTPNYVSYCKLLTDSSLTCQFGQSTTNPEVVLNSMSFFIKNFSPSTTEYLFQNEVAKGHASYIDYADSSTTNLFMDSTLSSLSISSSCSISINYNAGVYAGSFSCNNLYNSATNQSVSVSGNFEIPELLN